MIAYLKGTLVSKAVDSVCIEVSGIGYEVGMSSKTLAALPDVGNDVQVFTYLQIREDAWALFGFLSFEEKALFLKMIGVTGVGPKVALSALSVFTPQEFAATIAAHDVAAVTSIPGIGKKTASRIVLELKGSLPDVAVGEGMMSNPQAVRGAGEALLSMGFTPAEVEVSLQGAPEGEEEGVLLQYALKRLGT